MELTYTVPLTRKLYMHGVLYGLWKSRAFLLAIALLAAIYSALFTPWAGVLTLLIVASVTWTVNSYKFSQLQKKLGGEPQQQYTFGRKELIIETKDLGKMELLREHASVYQVYRDAVYFNYRRTNGVCVFLPLDTDKRDDVIKKLVKLGWIQRSPKSG